jgi:hypothetical protein
MKAHDKRTAAEQAKSGVWIAAQLLIALFAFAGIFGGMSLLLHPSDASSGVLHSLPPLVRAWTILLLGTAALVAMILRWRWGIVAWPAAYVFFRCLSVRYSGSLQTLLLMVSWAALTLLAVWPVYRRKPGWMDSIAIVTNIYCVSIAVVSEKGVLHTVSYLAAAVACIAAAGVYHFLAERRTSPQLRGS